MPTKTSARSRLGRTLGAALVAFAAGACGNRGDMSSRDYCEARQDAWERAFPDQPQTAEQHRIFVESCIKVTTRERATGEYAVRLRCLRESLQGTGDAKAEYEALIACEQRDLTLGGR